MDNQLHNIDDNKIDAALDRMRDQVRHIEKSATSDSDLRTKLYSNMLEADIVDALLQPLKGLDPFSSKYIETMYRLHDRLTRKQYSVENEGLPDLSIEAETRFGFPWGTRDAQVIGETLIAVGNLIQKAKLFPGASILEVGAGFGSLTEPLARAGYRVDALDVNAVQCEILRRKTQAITMRPNIICSDLLAYLQSTTKKYDAVIFFASFHHFINHAKLLHLLVQNHLADDGKIIMGHEPLSRDAYSLPWSFEFSTSGLRAILQWGWIELAFSEAYIRELFARLDMNIDLERDQMIATKKSRTNSAKKPAEFVSSISCSTPYRTGESLQFDTVTLTNTGYGSWLIDDERVKLGWKCLDECETVVHEGRIPLPQAEVYPGESITLPVSVSPPPACQHIVLQLVWEYWQWFGEEKIFDII